jgi:leucine-rich repeat protein SHOC2
MSRELLLLPCDSPETDVPHTISTLTHIHTLKVLGKFAHETVINMEAVTSLQSHLHTCIIHYVQLAPPLDDKSNAIYSLTNLRHLELVDCGVSGIHDTFSNLTALQTLVLHNSELNMLPSSISTLTALRYLDLERCALTELDDTISTLTSLRTLVLAGNQTLKTLPTSMSTLTSLQHLSLSFSKIQCDVLISVVCRLPLLQVLDLDWILHLNTIPPQISQLTALQHLSLSSTHITSLPTQIGLLTRLHTLNLEQCPFISHIPSDVELLKNLTAFRLSRAIRKEHRFSMRNWTKLQVLVLCDLEIDTIPSEIWSLKELRELSLSSNKLRFVPSAISQLTNLELLKFANNELTEITNDIRQLTQLRELDLSFNQLHELPDCVSLLIHLTKLCAYGNTIDKISTQLPYRLVELNLGSNSIVSIPFTALSLTSLEILNLSDNQVTLIPTQIGLLTSLRELQLTNNKLIFIPSDLNSLSNLNLEVSMNKLTYIPLLQLRSVKKLYFKENPLKFPLDSKRRQIKTKLNTFTEVYFDLYDV